MHEVIEIPGMTQDRKEPTYLDIVEPHPVEPPSYQSTLPKMARPAYDSPDPLNEVLPEYEPTSYKIGVLSRKMEWTSPLELAQHRQWKSYIFELNNTQLNLYQFPPNLNIENGLQVGSSFSGSNSHSLLHPYHYHHIYLRRLQGVICPTAFKSDEQADYNEDNYRSVMTTKSDLRALRYFKSLNLLEPINIVRSYSLQYGRVGLAIDYKKKNKVFRCRLESEQFLVEFENTEGMIEWYNALNLGIDNALDLNRREMPSYRTVPRRRRRIKVKPNNVQEMAKNVALGFGLGHPASNKLTEHSKSGSNLLSVGRGKKSSRGLSSLKNKLFGGSNHNKKVESVATVSDQASQAVLDLFQEIHQPDEPGHIDDLELDEDGFEVERPEADESDEDDDEEEFEIETTVEGPEEAADLSDDEPQPNKIAHGSIRRESSTYVGLFKPETYQVRSYLEYIAKPTRSYTKHTYPQQRKILRDSLRCIPPLTDNERWLGRYIVLDYDKRYEPQTKRDVERHFASMEVKTHIEKVGDQYVHHWRRALQEWIVTPSGLMPYINENWDR